MLPQEFDKYSRLYGPNTATSTEELEAEVSSLNGKAAAGAKLGGDYVEDDFFEYYYDVDDPKGSQNYYNTYYYGDDDERRENGGHDSSQVDNFGQKLNIPAQKRMGKLSEAQPTPAPSGVLTKTDLSFKFFYLWIFESRLSTEKLCLVSLPVNQSPRLVSRYFFPGEAEAQHQAQESYETRICI